MRTRLKAGQLWQCKFFMSACIGQKKMHADLYKEWNGMLHFGLSNVLAATNTEHTDTGHFRLLDVTHRLRIWLVHRSCCWPDHTLTEITLLISLQPFSMPKVLQVLMLRCGLRLLLLPHVHTTVLEMVLACLCASMFV